VTTCVPTLADIVVWGRFGIDEERLNIMDSLRSASAFIRKIDGAKAHSEFRYIYFLKPSPLVLFEPLTERLGERLTDVEELHILSAMHLINGICPVALGFRGLLKSASWDCMRPFPITPPPIHFFTNPINPECLGWTCLDRWRGTWSRTCRGGSGGMSGRKVVGIMEYSVIKTNLLKSLVKKVNEAIKEGWKPLGGVCLDVGYGFAQAMVRETK